MTEERLQTTIFDAFYYKDKLQKANKRIANYVKRLEILESRTCENCKHYNTDTAVDYCNLEVVFIQDLKVVTVPEDFGCNRFERSKR